MKNIILVLAIVYLTISVVVIQSNQSDQILPYKSATLPSTIHAISQAPNAVWISDGICSLYEQNIKIIKQFYASCGSKMTVYANANQKFNIFINGIVVLSGSPSQKIINSTFIPKCGINNFTIVVSYKCPLSLIYAIAQDTSSCYNCPVGQTWNPKYCKCECRNTCCTDNQIFRGFPLYDCACKNQTTFKKQCDQKRYWDENSCFCQCLPVYCPSGYIQNKTTCLCNKCIRDRDCIWTAVWSDIVCGCVPKIPLVMDAPTDNAN